MNIVFLDIDGVLNSLDWRKRRGPRTYDAYHLDYWRHNIDPEAVVRLNSLLDATAARLVVSSSWRTMLTTQELQYTLTQRGFRFEIAGATPEICNGSRWQEIRSHLLRWPLCPEYVILDDDPLPDAPQRYLVQTDYSVGLTDVDVYRAIEILQGAI